MTPALPATPQRRSPSLFPAAGFRLGVQSAIAFSHGKNYPNPSRRKEKNSVVTTGEKRRTTAKHSRGTKTTGDRPAESRHHDNPDYSGDARQPDNDPADAQSTGRTEAADAEGEGATQVVSNAAGVSGFSEGDRIRAQSNRGEAIEGIITSLGRTYAQLDNHKNCVALLEGAQLIKAQAVPFELLGLVGREWNAQAGQLLEDHRFYSLNAWSGAKRSKPCIAYKGWDIGFHKDGEVDITKNEYTWYAKLKDLPPPRGSGKEMFVDCCREAIDHVEERLAALAECLKPEPDTLTKLLQEVAKDFEGGAIAPDNSQQLIIENQPESITVEPAEGFKAGDRLKSYWVITFQLRTHPYRLPEFAKVRVLRETPHTIRVTDSDRQWNQPKHKAWCLPTQASWEKFQNVYADYQGALDGLAAKLRGMDRYDRLFKKNPKGANPLTPTAIEIHDPDYHHAWSTEEWRSPQAFRYELERHTPVMLRTLKNGKPWGMQAQALYFACPDDETWECVEALAVRAKACADALTVYLNLIGTYAQVLQEGEDWTELDPQESEPAAPSASTHELAVKPSAFAEAYEAEAHELAKSDPLTTLAINIKAAYSDCEQALTVARSAESSALEHAKRCGELLLEAKKASGHGGWEAWRNENTGIPSSTASLYQRIAERWDEVKELKITSLKGIDAHFRATKKQLKANPQPSADLPAQQPARDDRQIVSAANVAAVAESGWIQTKDGQNLNPQHYKAEGATRRVVERPEGLVYPDGFGGAVDEEEDSDHLEVAAEKVEPKARKVRVGAGHLRAIAIEQSSSAFKLLSGMKGNLPEEVDLMAVADALEEAIMQVLEEWILREED